MKHTRESILSALASSNILTIKEFREKLPAMYLWYTRHTKEVGELPLQAIKQKNGYWTYEACAEAAKKFQFRSEFQNQEKGAYLKALRAGWLDKICAHMVPKETDGLTDYAKDNLIGKPAINRKDLVGQTFGNWTVLGFSRRHKRVSLWSCKCGCKHGTVSEVGGGALIKGTSTKCTKCSNQVSIAQKKIYEFVVSLGFSDAVLCDRSTGKEIDIYVPSKNLAIEYDGLNFHSTRYRTTEKSEKERYNHFINNKIPCFRIFEDEFAANEELVYAMIKSRLGIRPTEKIGDYEIRYIEKPTKYRKFFEVNHIDGYGNSAFAFGAFVNGVLVSCISFRKYTRGTYAGQLELSRFCSDYTIDTYGIFSKLLKAAKKHAKSIGIKYIVSASDNRLSQGGIYANNGFTLVKNKDRHLNYYHFQLSTNERHHRLMFRKLNVPEITEAELAQYPTERAQTESGFSAFKKFGKWEPLYRIYGWGNKLWVLEIK